MNRAVDVVVHPETDLLIAHAARAAYPNETGGLLLGWWQGDSVVVRNAVEVIDTAATTHSWQREPTSAQCALASALAHHQHPWLGYVGDWHSHPLPCGPSAQDRRSIRRVSRNLPGPAVLLVHRHGGTLNAVVARAGQLRNSSITRPLREGTLPGRTP